MQPGCWKGQTTAAVWAHGHLLCADWAPGPRGAGVSLLAVTCLQVGAQSHMPGASLAPVWNPGEKFHAALLGPGQSR